MTPNDDTHDQELIARYRRASDADAAGPSETVRAAILAESRRAAAELAKQAPRQAFDVSRPAANDFRWKITAFGTVGAALLAALLFAPRYWENARPAKVSMAPAPSPAAELAQKKDQAPKLAELKADAAASNTAPARQSPAASTSLQEVVVTQADRKSSKSNGAPLPQLAAPAPAAAPPVTNSIVQNYAPAAPAARAKLLDSSAFVGGVPSKRADAAGADSALQPATLQSAVAQGDVAQAALLLDQGAVIDARDAAGRTPLMLAVTEDRLEIVRLLLARGADPNAADNAGHTPLQQATKRNLQDVAELLEQAGAH
jgi:hypothetical protein